MSDDPPTHQVVGEELEQERGFVGVEVGGGGPADAEGVLEFCNERLDASAVAAGSDGCAEVTEIASRARIRDVEPLAKLDARRGSTRRC